MDDINATLTVLGVEMGIVMTLVVITLLVVLSRSKRADQNHANKFVKKLRNNEQERAQKVRDLLSEICVLEEELVAEHMHDLMVHEKRVYSRALKLFLGKSRDISKIEGEVRALLSTYTALVAEGVRQDSKLHEQELKLAADKMAAFETQIEELEEEKRGLYERIADAEQEMNNLLKEYTLMYNKGEGISEAQETEMKKKIRQNAREEPIEPIDDW